MRNPQLAATLTARWCFQASALRWDGASAIHCRLRISGPSSGRAGSAWRRDRRDSRRLIQAGPGRSTWGGLYVARWQKARRVARFTSRAHGFRTSMGSFIGEVLGLGGAPPSARLSVIAIKEGELYVTAWNSALGCRRAVR